MRPGSPEIMVIKYIGMPRGSNKFYTKDKVEVAQRAAEVLDPKKVSLVDFVMDAQRFVIENNIMPSDEVEADDIVRIAAEGNKFSRLAQEPLLGRMANDFRPKHQVSLFSIIPPS